ncbi:MAG: CHASE2 domain-containing protein [Acidobacteria bacterium]|nr:CHASE2 domain-containing protein [Acidobacteriota bacterium]MBI3421576.1 CHASE2 domain-containing protein [Acidobacteriota bacterium]
MIRNNQQALRTGLILALSITLVVLVTWFAPTLSAASLNLLFRLRGALPAPADVVILAIDDQSLRRIGQWPWPRSVMATVVDRLTQARARSIGLDIIYAEPSSANEDRQLAQALARNRRVVLPAQLYESAAATGAADGAPTVAWLRPLPLFAAAASGIGHAHIAPGVDGMARSLQLSKADDRAERLWAFGLEVVRIAEQIAENDWAETGGQLRFGPYVIPVMDESARAALSGVTVIRPNEMLINYAGPTRSFQHYSIADLLDEKVPLTAFTNKLVLIGAVAQSMGDTRVVPFMHYNANAQEGGQEMPGVEIHANIIHSLRGHLTLRTLPDWLNFGLALLVILSCALTIRWVDGWRQVALLGLISVAICVGSFWAFSRARWIPPLVPMLTGFAAVIPLLLNRSLAASAELDQKLATLVSSQRGFLTGATQTEADYLEREQALALPQSLHWKLRAVDDLTTRLLTRMSFVNRILSSMGESVLVADLRGRIVFANHEARQFFGCDEQEMLGRYFEEFLLACGKLDATQLRAAISAVLSGQHAQLEFEIAAPTPRHCSLLLSALNLGTQCFQRADSASGDFLPAGAGLLWSPHAGSTAYPEAIGVVALFSDITRRVELDRMKTETLQLVSHELRTPLTSIQGLSDVLLKFPVAADESRELIGTIHAESLRLSETINRYLDLTRLESGAQALHLAPLDCQELIGGCQRNLTVLAAERGITLNSQINAAAPMIQADAQLLAQALNNLLSNAIKYSPPDTAVTILAEREAGGLALTVRDQGYGIPAAAHARIFEKFYRLERDASSTTVGTGLGLPFVKEIAEQHGGRVTFESVEGHGSRFTLHLPASVTT